MCVQWDSILGIYRFQEGYQSSVTVHYIQMYITWNVYCITGFNIYVKQLKVCLNPQVKWHPWLIGILVREIYIIYQICSPVELLILGHEWICITRFFNLHIELQHLPFITCSPWLDVTNIFTLYKNLNFYFITWYPLLDITSLLGITNTWNWHWCYVISLIKTQILLKITNIFT